MENALHSSFSAKSFLFKPVQLALKASIHKFNTGVPLGHVLTSNFNDFK